MSQTDKIKVRKLLQAISAKGGSGNIGIMFFFLQDYTEYCENPFSHDCMWFTSTSGYRHITLARSYIVRLNILYGILNRFAKSQFM